MFTTGMNEKRIYLVVEYGIEVVKQLRDGGLVSGN